MESVTLGSVDAATSKANSKHLKIRAAQVKQLYSQGHSGLIGALLGAIVLTAALWNVAPKFRLIMWLVGYVLASLPRQILIISYEKSGPPADHVIWWEKWFAILSVTGALFWGLAGVLLFPVHSIPDQFLLAVFVTGISCGAALAYWPSTFCYVPAILVELLPLSGRFIYEGDQVHVIIGMVIALFAVILIVMGNHMRSMNSETVESKLEISSLADSLQKSRDELELKVEERTAELRESEFRLSRAELVTGLGNWEIYLSTKKVTASNGGRKIYGVGQQELILDDIQKIPLQEYRYRLDEALIALIKNGAPYDIKFQIKRANDNQVIDIHSIAYYDSEKNSVFGIIHDITERKHMEEKNQRLAAIVGSSDDAIISTTLDGAIASWNKGAERIYGYKEHEVAGRPMTILAPHDREYEIQGFLQQNKRGESVKRIETIRRNKVGDNIPVSITISPIIDKEGSIIGAATITRDISDRLKAAQQREALQEQLFQAQKMEAIGTLAGGFAHDFNNKLQVISSYVERIFFNKDLPETVKSQLEVIEKTVDSSAELIRGMMVFSRRTPIQLQPIELNKLVAQTMSILTRSMPKIIEIDLLLADDLWAINAAPNQIDQILMNLAVNARDAMPHGGRLAIKTQNVELGEEYCLFNPVAKPGRYALMTVSDRGIGMNRETASHVFEPFFTTKEPGKGTGLGLAVVYGIVEQYGGWIVCDSVPSVGTIFGIYFPAIEEVL